MGVVPASALSIASRRSRVRATRVAAVAGHVVRDLPGGVSERPDPACGVAANLHAGRDTLRAGIDAECVGEGVGVARGVAIRRADLRRAVVLCSGERPLSRAVLRVVLVAHLAPDALADRDMWAFRGAPLEAGLGCRDQKVRRGGGTRYAHFDLARLGAR